MKTIERLEALLNAQRGGVENLDMTRGFLEAACGALRALPALLLIAKAVRHRWDIDDDDAVAVLEADLHIHVSLAALEDVK